MTIPEMVAKPGQLERIVTMNRRDGFRRRPDHGNLALIRRNQIPVAQYWTPVQKQPRGGAIIQNDFKPTPGALIERQGQGMSGFRSSWDSAGEFQHQKRK
jgi:hypothetical protein